MCERVCLCVVFVCVTLNTVYSWSARSADCGSTVCNPPCGQLKRGNYFPPVSAPENSRDGCGRIVPRHPTLSAHPGSSWFLLTGPPDFRNGVYLYRQPPSCQSRVYQVTHIRHILTVFQQVGLENDTAGYLLIYSVKRRQLIGRRPLSPCHVYFSPDLYPDQAGSGILPSAIFSASLSAPSKGYQNPNLPARNKQWQR